MNPRTRSALYATLILLAVGLVVWAGFDVIRNSRVTTEKVKQYVSSTDLAAVRGDERAERLRQLERMVNGLSAEERRQWWKSDAWRKWFDKMNEVEKGQYIEATMPSGVRQCLESFDVLPEERRKEYMDFLMKELKDSHRLVTDQEPGQPGSMYGTNLPPRFSPEMEKRVWTIGLKTFYTESSAETKAELAPLLEELQRQMERGKVAR